MIEILTSVAEVRAAVTEARRQGRKVGYIITTGSCHKGHAALVAALLEVTDFVVVSNMSAESGSVSNVSTPADAELLDAAGASVLFAPTLAEIYPDGLAGHAEVWVPGVSEVLCGRKRPRLFGGVAGVVLKMLNIVQPDVTAFGEKDYQQFAVVKKLVRDLMLPVDVISVPTVRYANGLAYASRNKVLKPEDLATAPALYRALCVVRAAVICGTKDYQAICLQASDYLKSHGMAVEYLEVRRADDLAEPRGRGDLIVFVAAYHGHDRLVDTLRIEAELIGSGSE